MTTGPIRGHNWRLLADDSGVYAATSCEIDIEVDTIELSHKDINPGSTGVTSKIRIPDIISASGSSTAYMYTAASNHKALVDKMLAGTEVTLEGTTDATGDHVISFNAIISGAKLAGNNGDISEITFKFKSTGDISSDNVA